MRSQDHDATNARTLDSSGNGRHATWTAGATAPTKLSGKHGYSFDGGDYMTIAAPPIATSPMTWAITVKQNRSYAVGSTTRDVWISSGIDAPYGSRLALCLFEDTIEMWLYGITNSFSGRVGTDWNTGVEMFVVLTHPGGTGTYKTYINGRLIVTSASCTPTINGTGTIWLGCYTDLTKVMLGNITRFASWPIALNQMQIYDLQTAWQMKASEV